MSTISGSTPAEREIKRVVEETMADPAIEDPGEERTIKFRTPGFSRMRTEWKGEDALIVASVNTAVEKRLVRAFPLAYALMNEIYDLVREPVIEDGEVLKDKHGFQVWQRTEMGAFIEDWTRLGIRHKEQFMFQITTNLFGWEQVAAELWSEAMMSKAQYEERFSIAYDEPRVGTIDDRIAIGKKDAAEERYFAILMATLSRRADSLVRSLERLGQRLKDTMD